MPIRNVSSEKEKLKLATIFILAGSATCRSGRLSVLCSHSLIHCFISFFAHFSLEMSRRAFMSCAPTKPLPAHVHINDTGRADSGQARPGAVGFNLRGCVRHILSACVLRVESSLNSLPVSSLCLLKHFFLL